MSEVLVGFVMGFACGALWMAHGLLMKGAENEARMETV